MAKLINILAVSLGSGLVLGAGIRALEGGRSRTADSADSGKSGGLGSHGQDPVIPNREERLLSRMDGLEARLSRIETSATAAGGTHATGTTFVASIHGRLDTQEAEADAVLARLARVETTVSRANEGAEKLAVELREWAASDIRRQIVEAETRLGKNLDAARREALETVVEGVQKRVSERIARLEGEVAGQAAAMVELRDCSVKTEQSIQKLLVGIDRLVTSQMETKAQPAGISDSQTNATVNSERQMPEPETLPRRRWSLFG
jgi:uncharacterized coiled-coil protein SlyX